MAKGAIDLVVKKEALEQVRELNKLLKESADAINEISKKAIGVKQTKGSENMTAEMREQKRLLKELEKAQAKYNLRNSEAAKELSNVKNKIQQHSNAIEKRRIRNRKDDSKGKGFFQNVSFI